MRISGDFDSGRDSMRACTTSKLHAMVVASFRADSWKSRFHARIVDGGMLIESQLFARESHAEFSELFHPGYSLGGIIFRESFARRYSLSVIAVERRSPNAC